MASTSHWQILLLLASLVQLTWGSATSFWMSAHFGVGFQRVVASPTLPYLHSPHLPCDEVPNPWLSHTGDKQRGILG